MLSVDKINVSYGELQVLWDVTLKVNNGEFVAIVGSNGVGKTTLLKTISGLLNPTTGKIELDGEQIDTIPARMILEKGIVLVPEGRLLFPKMSVLENLEMGAYLPESWSKRRETIEDVFALFPRLKERKTQKAGTLSGGEQQMLAIGRALMSHPSLLMLDEPSLGLAPKLVLKTFDIVEKLNEKGITILLVEQNIRLALQHAHRAYVLESGRVVLEGAQKELIDNEHVKKVYLGM